MNHRTKIVCTLGPSSDRPGILDQMLRAGMDVARINGAHGNFDVHRERIQKVRAAAHRMAVPIAILMDLPGPKFRLGKISQASMEIRRGEEILLGTEKNQEGIPLPDDSFTRDLKPHDPVFLADGTVQLEVLRAGRGFVYCRVEFGGVFRSGSGINLPKSELSVRLPTADDRQGIRFAIKEKLEWIGISFVRTPQDLIHVRKTLPPTGGPMVMAKIEKRDALANLESIIQLADGVMVARGDLGVETPLESVPIAQKRIISEAVRLGKPVITATQMLESMVEHSSPTRAEVTDVANAVLDGTDAVMLSAETAIGANAVKAVQTLTDVIGATEANYPFGSVLQRLSALPWNSMEDAVALSVCRLSYDLQLSAIVVAGEAAASAARIARFRPSAPVIAVTRHEMQAQQSNLIWNVRPLLLKATFEPVALRARLLATKMAKRGDRIVVVGVNPRPSSVASDMIQVVQL